MTEGAPHSFAALRLRGTELAEEGHFREAVAAFTQALQAAGAARPPAPGHHGPIATCTRHSAGSAPDIKPQLRHAAAAAGAGAGAGDEGQAPAAPTGMSVESDGRVAGAAAAAAAAAAAVGEPAMHVTHVTPAEVAAVHEMAAQCLLELAWEQRAARGAGEAGGGEEDGEDGGDGQGAGAVPRKGPGASGQGQRHEVEADGQQGEELGEGEEDVLLRQALTHAHAAVALMPEWVPGLLTFARCCRNGGLLDEALRTLRTAQQQVAAHADPTRPARVEGQDSTSRNTQPAEAEQDGEHQAGHEKEGEGDGLHRGLAGEVAEELAEVGDLWRRRVARDVGLPGLVVQQDAGDLGAGPGRRVWECGLLLAAYLVAHAGPSSLAAARVLELGCGSGLPGIAAAACGARVLLTDQPQLLHTAHACLAANQQLVHAGGGWAGVRALEWGDTEQRAQAVAWLVGQGQEREGAPGLGVEGGVWQDEQGGVGASERGRGLGCNGRCWVLGADLVYSAAQVEPLVGVLGAVRQAVAAAAGSGGGPVHVGARAAAGMGQAVAGSDSRVGVEDAAERAQQGGRHAAGLALVGRGGASGGGPANCVGQVSAGSCTLLLVHKHRSEAVDGQLFAALRGIGLHLLPVVLTAEIAHAGGAHGELDSIERLRRLARSTPSVQLYACEL